MNPHDYDGGARVLPVRGQHPLHPRHQPGEADGPDDETMDGTEDEARPREAALDETVDDAPEAAVGQVPGRTGEILLARAQALPKRPVATFCTKVAVTRFMLGGMVGPSERA